jgi:hypothetical protein
MAGVVKNSSLSNREEMLEQMKQMSQPNPEEQKMKQNAMGLELAQKQADVQKTQAEAQKLTVEAQLAPDVSKAKIMASLSNNLQSGNEQNDFDQRAKIAELMLKEKSIDSNHAIAEMQVAHKLVTQQKEHDYLKSADNMVQ